MSRTCTACNHPQRDSIDLSLLEGGSLRDIARQFSLSKDALSRHKESHLPGQLAKAHEANETVSAGTLLDRLREITAETRTVLQAAKKSKHHELSLKAIARLERQLELEARMLGELQENATTTINVYSTPEWVVLRSTILNALGPFPDAAKAVAGALNEHS